MSRGGDGGQSTVELALVLPLLVMMALALLQVSLVGRDAVAVTHAARAAARTAVVEPTDAAARDAAIGAVRLDPDRLSVDVVGVTSPGATVTVRVRYRAPTTVPLIGRLIGDVGLSEELVAMVE